MRSTPVQSTLMQSTLMQSTRMSMFQSTMPLLLELMSSSQPSQDLIAQENVQRHCTKVLSKVTIYLCNDLKSMFHSESQ